MEKTNLNVAPFYDDFDESKNFHKILFRPGFAVQGRELTQLQTILQNQIERFGQNIFQDGSPVTGAQTNLFTDVTYIKLESTFNSLVLNSDNFQDAEIVETTGRGARARIIAVSFDTTSADPPTLMVRYVSGEEFLPSDTLALSSAPSIGIARIRSESTSLGKGSVATIQDGVFFIRGFFVHTPKQVVILDKYGVVPTYDVGLEITESIITDRDDTSLLDPALDSSNFQAPGASRLAIYLTFNKRTTTSLDLSEFVKLLKIQNGIIIEQVKYPIYNEIEKTLARRTFDESGNYTVKAFRVTVGEDASNNNNYLLTLDPGKAYVFGFELETLAPITIPVPKPRTNTSINNYALSINYGNYVLVQNSSGFFNTSTYPSIDLHCVPTASLDFANTPFYTNTKIGTARIREWAFSSLANPGLSSTYVYRAHLFDVNTVSYSANSAGTNSAINSINLAPQYSTTANAYAGAIITLTAGPGAGDRRTIVSYDGTSKIATVDQNFSIIPTTATQFAIDFQFKDTESIAIRALAGVNAFADIASGSKDTRTTFDDAVLTDTAFEKLIFELPYSFIVATDAANGITGINDISYQYRKVFTPTLVSNTAILNLSGVEQFVGSVGLQSALQKESNWSGAVLTPSGAAGFVTKGLVAAMGDPSVSINLTGTQTANVTVGSLGNSSIALIALVNVTNGGRKTKTKIVANTTVIAASGGIPAYDESGTVVPGVTVFASFGQVDFANTQIIPKTSDTDLNLYIPDGFALVKVIQSAGSAISVALADLTNPASDITSSYTFDNGQRDSYYNHTRIRLKAGVRPPTGQLRVFLTYYDHDLNAGYFSVDSYPNANNQSGYAEIPNYAINSGKIISLRDVVDFRPRKTIGYANTFTSPTYIAAAATNFNLDFAYYLARIDNLVLTRDRRFEVVRGIDSLMPASPKSRDDAMLLNRLSMPPYVVNAPNTISITSFENKRYTMRDIGALEKRIDSLEYYTTLSLLEQQTLNKKDNSIQDDLGLERTKNGIIVDSFADWSVCDLSNRDFAASLDPLYRVMKPTFNNGNFDMFFYANGSAPGSYSSGGTLVSLPYNDATPLIMQNLASIAVNINPFNVTKWAGTVDISPSNDTWIDTNTTVVSTNPSAGLPLVTTQVMWENWTTLYNGILYSPTYEGRQAGVTSAISLSGLDPNATQILWENYNSFPASYYNNLGVSVRQFQSTVRTIQYQEVTTAQGTRLLNTTIIPFIRSRPVNFSSKNLRPNTAYYAFFDGVDVTNYIGRGNILRLDSNPSTSGVLSEEFKETYGAPDVLSFYDNYPPASPTFKGCAMLLTYAANIGVTVPTTSTQGATDYVRSLGPAVFSNTTNNAVTSLSNMGADQSASQNISLWHNVTYLEHYSGKVASANATSVSISNSAHANASFFSPSIGQRSWANLASFSPAQWTNLGQDGVVRIVSGTGAGQARGVTNYNLATNVLSVNVAWSVTPDTTSIYSLGLPRSAVTGHIGGVFYIPNTSITRFATGDRILKLSDSPTNNDNLTSSTATGRYSASGTMREVAQDVLVTRSVVSVNDSTTTQNLAILSSSSATTYVGTATVPGDPLAQSFFVDPKNYPNGVFLSKFRICFTTKDNFLPVRAQIRTMINGIPNAREFIEEISVNPQYVNTTSQPSLVDADKYTLFNFSRPIYLAAGFEYAIVLLSDSNQYNVWVAETGLTDINSGAVIAKQPTLGSLFKSQNGSTWTPAQEQDLMFSLHICQFDISQTANVNFRIHPTSANANLDLFYFSSQTVSPPGTDINYKYTSELVSGGLTSPAPFIPNITTYFNDVLGRRVFKAGSNNSFGVYALMSSTNQWVSPMVDISVGLSVFGIEYQINNGELSNTNIILTNGGTGYLASDNSNITVTISGGGGSGAVAQVNSISNGAVSDIIFTNPGFGYYSTPQVSLGFVGNATMRIANTNVAATIIGETSTRGGNARHRYLMQKVTLADGFQSSDLRVYLTTYKPPSCSIYVYYKVLSSEDSDIWDNKPWNVMTQLGNTLTSSKNRNNLLELTFAPGSGGVASNEVIYSGFATFRNFAIKVVTFSTNPTDVAEFKDIRVIALPSGKVI